MYRFLFLFFPIVWWSCGGTAPKNKAIDTAIIQSKYDSVLADNAERQNWFQRVYQNDDATRKKERLLEAHHYLHRVLKDEIWPCWKTTRWDYNGTSTRPREGHIACGYFVTTTLKHAGFQIERSKLAQQAASNIIHTLCKPGSLKIIGGNDFEKLKTYLYGLPEGIYIIGLDHHVGFILRDGEDTEMVHSTAWPDNQVIIEPIAQSRNLKNSNAYYIGNLLDHAPLLEKWINKQAIPTRVR